MKRVPKGVVLFLIPNLIWLLLAYYTDARQLINVLNVVCFSLSIGVCVTYLPEVIKIALSPWPLKKADVLVTGIFVSWFGSVYFNVYSMVWRAQGQPIEMTNSDFNGYSKYCYICAAAFHLAGSGSIGDENVPNIEYVRIGLLTAASVFVAMMTMYVASRYAETGFVMPLMIG